MSEQSNNRENELITRMTTLINVRPSETIQTVKFRGVKHDELCSAIEYWLDQTKMIFGEVAWIQKTQALNDAGVDLALDLVRSNVRLGFQVKSFYDIKSSDFASKVKAQITESKKHNLNCFYIAFAGDLTNNSQAQRVGYIISEIHQYDDSSLIVIPPEKLLVIWEAFKNNQHPLKFVEMKYKDLILLIKGVSESLSTKERKVTLSLKIDYNLEESNAHPIKISMGLDLSEEDYDLFDRIQKAHYTGESVTISKNKIRFIDAFEGGIPLFTGDKVTKITITPEKPKIAFSFQTISEKEKILETIENYEFERTFNGEELSITPVNKDFPLQLKLTLETRKTTQKEFLMNFNFNLRPYKGDVKQVLKALNFLLSFHLAKFLRIIEVNTGLEQKIQIPTEGLPRISQDIYSMVNGLAFIQEKTGVVFTLPENFPEMLDQEKNNIVTITNGISRGYIFGNSLGYELGRIDALRLLENYKKNEAFSGVYRTRFEIILLGKKVDLGPVSVNLEELSPREEVEQLMQELVQNKDDMVQIQLKPIEKHFKIVFDWFSITE